MTPTLRSKDQYASLEKEPMSGGMKRDGMMKEEVRMHAEKKDKMMREAMKKEETEKEQAKK